jgi:hypothetical protein
MMLLKWQSNRENIVSIISHSALTSASIPTRQQIARNITHIRRTFSITLLEN